MPRLPFHDRAVIDLRKIEDYCLSPTHLRGRHKARVSREALNLNRSDARWLRDRLLAFTTFPRRPEPPPYSFPAFNVAFAVLTIAITVTAFRRGEVWSWWALLVANTIAFGSAMTYDWMANAIGPFEMLEYVGIIGVYVALGVTAPFLAPRRSV